MINKVIALILMVLFSGLVKATTGIGSVAYLWVLLLGIFVVVALAVWIIKFLARVRHDSKMYESKDD